MSNYNKGLEGNVLLHAQETLFSMCKITKVYGWQTCEAGENVYSFNIGRKKYCPGPCKHNKQIGLVSSSTVSPFKLGALERCLEMLTNIKVCFARAVIEMTIKNCSYWDSPTRGQSRTRRDSTESESIKLRSSYTLHKERIYMFSALHLYLLDWKISVISFFFWLSFWPVNNLVPAHFLTL